MYNKCNLPEIKAEKIKSRIVFKKEDGTRAEYDLGTKKFYKTTKTKTKLYEVTSITPFFTHYKFETIANSFEDKQYAKFVRIVQNFESRCSNMGTILLRLSEYAIYEQYFAAGLNVDTRTFIYRNNKLNEPMSLYNKRTLKIFKNRGVEISGSLERTYKDYKKQMDSIIAYLDGNDEYFYDFFEIFTSRYGNGKIVFLELVETYNYEYKSLIKYFSNIKLFEGYDIKSAMVTLRDYARMNIVINEGGKFDKYPHYLKVMHDITQRNFKSYNEKCDENAFVEAVEKYKDLEYSNKEFCIIAPKKSKDMKEEGSRLNHCVASYVKYVIDEKTKIVFMREKDKKERNLITIEIKEDEVRQVRGRSNRLPDTNEKEFIKKFAKAKKLKYI